MGAVGERELNIRVYLSFIEHKALKYYICSRENTSKRWFRTGMGYKDPELVHSRSFEMNWQQTYRGQVFMLCGGKVRLFMIIPSLWACMF